MTDYLLTTELAGYLGINDGADNIRLAAAITAASRTIDTQCRRRFFADTTTSARIFRPDDFYFCQTDDIATTAGLVVATDQNADGTYETTWTIGTDFLVEPRNGVVDGIEGYPTTRLIAVGSRAFPCFYPRIVTVGSRLFPRPIIRLDSVQITATWGWPTVPAPVKQACLIIAADLFKRKDAPFGVAGFGDLGVLRIKDDPTVRAMLAPYSRGPAIA